MESHDPLRFLYGKEVLVSLKRYRSAFRRIVETPTKNREVNVVGRRPAFSRKPDRVLVAIFLKNSRDDRENAGPLRGTVETLVAGIGGCEKLGESTHADETSIEWAVPRSAAPVLLSAFGRSSIAFEFDE